MADAGNEAQRAFWNSEVGRRWVSRGADLDAMHAGVTAILLEACRPASGESVLDVGCGAGATTFALGEAVGPTGLVLGFDISEPLLARAEERRAEAGLAQVRFRLGDAAADPLPEGLDLVASRFGMMFFADPGEAFRHLAGALRRGGRMVFVAWAGPELNPWFTVPLSVAADRLGAPEPSSPTAPGPLAFADRERVVGLMAAAGLADCNAELKAVALHHPGGVPALRDLALVAGPASRLIREKEASEADVASIGAAIGAALAGYAGDDGARLPAGVNLFRAVRPG